MKSKTAFYLASPGPRPGGAELTVHLFGPEADTDGDGDSEFWGDTEWTELTIALRPKCTERIDVDPISLDPLVLKITSYTPALAESASRFLQNFCGGTLHSEWPPAQQQPTVQPEVPASGRSSG